jgi:hypothetical protein
VELQGDVCVDAEGVVVVDDIEGQVLLALGRVLVGRGVRLRVALDDQLPAIEYRGLALGEAHQDLADGLVRVTAAPTEGPGEVVAGAEGQGADRRPRRSSDLVQDREDPADGTVAAAGQDAQIWNLLEELEPAREAGRVSSSEVSWLTRTS